ncbi:MAG: hypothetical protein ACH349_06230, partial [Candidatus Rhabdochlamydia sp.]
MNKRSFLFVLILTVGFFFLNQWLFPPKTPQGTATGTQKIYVEPATEPQPLATEAFQQQQQQFFVIENAYQQLVFSNIGGSIAEINLALHNKKDTQTPVRPIAFDRIIEKDFPQNSHFPSFPYFVNDGTAEEKINNPKIGGYYPLLRRTLF